MSEDLLTKLATQVLTAMVAKINAVQKQLLEIKEAADAERAKLDELSKRLEELKASAAEPAKGTATRRKRQKKAPTGAPADKMTIPPAAVDAVMAAVNAGMPDVATIADAHSLDEKMVEIIMAMTDEERTEILKGVAI